MAKFAICTLTEKVDDRRNLLLSNGQYYEILCLFDNVADVEEWTMDTRNRLGKLFMVEKTPDGHYVEAYEHDVYEEEYNK